MTIARRKTKVKKKKKATRKPPGTSRPKKRPSGKTKKRPTRAQLERLQRELAKAKQALARARKKKRPAPGTLASPRSEAARKGWTRRRQNAAERERKRLEGIAASFVPATPAGRPISTAEMLEEVKKHLTEEALEEIEFLERPEVKEQLRALYIKKMPDLFVEGMDYLERPEPKIMARLILAQVRGDFQEVAYQIADETGYEANEIYGFWHGYALSEPP